MLKKALWKISLSLKGTSFDNEYNEARKLNVRDSLKNILLHAYNNVPYYHSLLAKKGAIQNGKLCLANFDRIPRLTKGIIRDRSSDLVSKDYGKRGWFWNATGGSTGEPVNFIQDKLFNKWVMATTKYYYEDILGFDRVLAKEVLLWGARQDIFGGSPGIEKRIEKAVNNALTNTIVLDSLSMTETDMERYARTINSYKPHIIRGYATSLYEFCRFLEKKQLTIHSPSIIVSSAETLHSMMREKIETVFGAKVYDFYGSREVDGVAGEFRCGLLHMLMFNNYTEVLDINDRPTREGEEGSVIITTLHNYSMPLIRYEIGDIAILGPEKCRCGNPLPTLKRVTGREYGYFVTENGKLIFGGYFTRLFLSKEWVRAFRVIQEDYKKIRILIVLAGKTTNKHEIKGIEEKIKLVLGKDCKVSWEFVREIPKLRSGKHMYTLSLVSKLV